MEVKQRLRQQLERSRDYSEQLLAAFHTPAQWTHQVHPQANHALWFAGHMGVVDNFLISLIEPDRADWRPALQERFGMGSSPLPDAGSYPPPADVLDYMHQRRAVLLAILDRLAEDDLNRPMPHGAPAFLPDFGSAFQTAAWHEGLHSGQLSVTHRALGNPPVLGGPPRTV